MAKLHQQLEQLFKYRINSNNEIIPFIKKLSESGKFDEPKKVAVLAIALDRLGKLEDEAALEDSLKEIALDPLPNTEPTQEPVVETPQQETTPVEDSSPVEIPQEPEKPAQTEATTSQDAPQQEEQPQEVQTPVEAPTETPETLEPAVTTPENQDTGTVEEFSLDAITDPQENPTTSS